MIKHNTKLTFLPPLLKGGGCVADGGIFVSNYKYMIKHNTKLTFNAKKQRKNMTLQEKRLWYDYLRKYPVNFLRQKVIDSYIVDFYCAKAKVAVEIDGEYHDFIKQSKDIIRTNSIEKYGIKVIHLSNSLIDKDFEKCCQIIDNIVKERLVEE